MKKILIIVGVVVLLIAVLFVSGIIKLGVEQESSSDVESTETPSAPTAEETAGNIVTIKNCASDPQILTIAAGETVTFKNTDSVDHTLFSPEIGGEVKLVANESLTVTPKFPFKNFTTNYTCDQQSLPEGGAIYAKP